MWTRRTDDLRAPAPIDTMLQLHAHRRRVLQHKKQALAAAAAALSCPPLFSWYPPLFSCFWVFWRARGVRAACRAAASEATASAVAGRAPRPVPLSLSKQRGAR